MKNNTKHKEIWSLGLYKESLRRIRIPAVIFFVIIASAAVLNPLLRFFASSQYTYPSYTIDYRPHMTAVNANPFLLVCMIAALTLTYTLFSFQNKRSSSDIYFSQPHTRLAMYTSRITALVTVIAGMILIPTGISAAMFAILKQHFNTQWDTFIPYMAGCFAAAMLICAVFAIAMSITGTILNNVVVAGLIMYLPRTVLTLVVASVCSKFPLIVDGYISKFLSPGINILTGFLEIFLSTNFYDNGILSSSAQVYTFCLALVYFVIGAVLFCRRKSESAERAAPTPFMQSVYRILITMVVCLIPCGLIFNADQIGSYEIFVIFCYYIIALLVYLFYELITTRKWKNLVKCLPGLVVVVILNITLIGTMQGLYKAEVNFTPNADEVEYVSLVRDPYDGYYLVESDYYSYALSLSSNIRITDSDAIKAVTDSLSANVDYYVKNGTMGAYSNFSEFANVNEIRRYTVKIKAGLTSKYRHVYMTGEQYDTLLDGLTKNDKFSEMLSELPDLQLGKISISSLYNHTDFEAFKLYEILKNEIKNVKLDNWAEFLSQYQSADLKEAFGSLNYFDGDRTTVYIPFSPEILPETSVEYIKLLNSKSYVSVEEIKDELHGNGSSKFFLIDSASLTLPNDKSLAIKFSGASHQYKLEKYLKKAVSTEDVNDFSKGFIKLQIEARVPASFSGKDDLQMITYTVFVPAAADAYEIYQNDPSALK